jgi:DNA polymerase-1
MDAFLNDQDIHVVSAAAVWGIDSKDVTPDQRRIAKVVNFGIVYGIGDQRLAYETGLTREEAAAFIAAYRQTYSGVTEFMDGVRAQAQLYGQVSTLLNRVRSLPEIHSNHPGVRQAAERAAINMPVQGTAADIIKIAMIRVARAMDELGVKSRMILQVHDELVFDVPQEEVDAMAHLVRDGMMHALDLAVPLGVEVNVGPNWGSMQRYDLAA